MKKILPLLAILLLLSACTPSAPDRSVDTQPALDPTSSDSSQTGLPNPASVYCEQQGGRLEMRTAADGSQGGVCIFPDGSQCDEWTYFRGECQPGDSQALPVDEPTQVVVVEAAGDSIASDGCNIYRSTEPGYSFHYPAGAVIENNDNPLHGISIIGPVIDGEAWPVFYISHPADREEYLPPEDVDLPQWLADHSLMGEMRLPDMQIAGATAVHFRHNRSPQSYAFDTYYFARAGQLYSITILHAGDREDWELYFHFLGSIQFDLDLANPE